MNELKLVQSGRTSNRARKFAKSGVGKTLEGKMTDYLSARFGRDTRVRFPVEGPYLIGSFYIEMSNAGMVSSRRGDSIHRASLEVTLLLWQTLCAATDRRTVTGGFKNETRISNQCCRLELIPGRNASSSVW
jgi:hypothetical protein